MGARVPVCPSLSFSVQAKFIRITIKNLEKIKLHPEKATESSVISFDTVFQILLLKEVDQKNKCKLCGQSNHLKFIKLC